jgi:uncharacterized protein (TIGR00290 family)
MAQAYMNWSGGKDSSLSLYRILQANHYQVGSLVTNVNAVHNRISMHGVRRELLDAQARSLHIPLETVELPEEPSMEEYEKATAVKTASLKKAGYTHAIFGDIFLEDLKKYREEKLQEQEIVPVFPIWKESTAELLKEFIGLGFKAVVVCVNERQLDKSFCGRFLDESFLRDLPEAVDPCGENGEYHSYVFEGPIFKNPITVQKGEIVYKTYRAPEVQSESPNPKKESPYYGFYFCDLIYISC